MPSRFIHNPYSGADADDRSFKRCSVCPQRRRSVDLFSLPDGRLFCRPSTLANCWWALSEADRKAFLAAHVQPRWDDGEPHWRPVLY